MALVDEIKARTKMAMKAKDDVAKDILRLALGEIQLVESRAREPLTEEAAQKVVRKLIASIQATLEVATESEARARLETETRILSELLPAQLSVEDIIEELEAVRAAILAAKADGPAVGVAMKHLEQTGAPVDGSDVRAAVRRIRTG